MHALKGCEDLIYSGVTAMAWRIRKHVDRMEPRRLCCVSQPHETGYAMSWHFLLTAEPEHTMPSAQGRMGYDAPLTETRTQTPSAWFACSTPDLRITVAPVSGSSLDRGASLPYCTDGAYAYAHY